MLSISNDPYICMYVCMYVCVGENQEFNVKFLFELY